MGAGAAGLAAARDLSGAGRHCILLEARERIGGRIHTLHQPGLALPIELGAEFIHGEVEETFGIVDAAALLAYQLPDDHWWVRGGKWQRDAGFWGKMSKVFARIRGGRDRSFADFLRAQRALSPRVRKMALGFVEGFNAAHADRISALSMRDQGEGGEFKQFRIANGYDAVIAWLHAGLDPGRATIRLGTPVTEIAWRRGGVAVQTSTTTVHAKAAIVTVPVGVLKAPDAIRITPEPRETIRALAHIEVGHVVKIILRFRERFWDDFNFLHAEDGPFPTWWTSAPVRAPILTGWAGGHAADRLLERRRLGGWPGSVSLPTGGEDAAGPAGADAGAPIVDAAIESLASLLGVSRRRVASQLDAVHMHDWQSDPFSRGAYSYLGVGGSHAYRALAKPVAGTLFFAGEATSDQTGTVAGAIASGRRAARQILGRL